MNLGLSVFLQFRVLQKNVRNLLTNRFFGAILSVAVNLMRLAKTEYIRGAFAEMR